MKIPKRPFAYVKVRKYPDGRLIEELCDVVLGCFIKEADKYVIESINKGDYTFIKRHKEGYDLLDVPVYEIRETG